MSCCPTVQQLRELLLGECSEEESLRLEQPLAACPNCTQAVQALPLKDTLTDAVRAGAILNDQVNSSKVQELLQLLRNFPSVPQGVTTSGHEPGTVPRAPATHSCESYSFLSPPQAADEMGRLGTYRVLKVLGAGGMGVVFHAEDAQLQRPVALKVMKQSFADGEAARQRFLREAQATAKVKHDHIVVIHQVGEDGGVPFLAMEFLEGESLDDRLKRAGGGQGDSPLPVGEVLRIGREIAEGLAAAHERELIHRDIKPGNIWLEGSRGRVKILDFGLARPREDDAHLTQSGIVVGTPAYMAPEQARGHALDGRCDLFSLGTVLYRLGTGQLPFKGPDKVAIVLAVQMDRVPPPRDLNPELPAALSDLVLWLLAKDRDDRPASAQVVADKLLAIETDYHEQIRRREQQEKTKSGKRRLLVALAACLLGILGVVAGSAVVIRIKGKDGKETTITVPDGSTVTVDDKGVAQVVLPKGEKLPDNPKPVGVMIEPEPLALAKGAPVSPTALVSRPPEIKGLRSWTIETRDHRQTGDSFSNHAKPVAYSPNGRWIATAGMDSTIRVWNASTGQLVRVLMGHQGAVLVLAWSPDGK